MRRAVLPWPLLCGSIIVLVACHGERRQALEALGSPQSGMRASALRRLAKTGDTALAVRIAPLTRDPVPRVRREAVAALGAIGVGKKLGAVMARLEDPDVEVRLTAVRVLGDSGRPVAKRVLLEILDDPNMVVRKAAERALKVMGLGRKEQRRARARKRFEADIVRLSARDEQVRATAARDLGTSGRAEAEAPLIARSADPSPLVLREIALALATLGSPKGAAALGKMARSREIAGRIAAAAGLAKKRAFAGLVPLLRDDDATVRRAAFEVIAEQKAMVAPAVLKEACAVLSKQEEGDDLATRLAAARVLGEQAKSCGPPLEKMLAAWSGDVGAGLKGVDGATQLWRCRVAAALARVELQLALTRDLYHRHRRAARRWINGEQWRALDEVRGKSSDKKPQGKPKGPHQRRKALEWLLARFKRRGALSDRSDPLLPPRVGRAVVSGAISALPLRAEVLPLLAEIAMEAPRALRVEALSRLAEVGATKGEMSIADGDKAPAAPAARAIWAGLRAEVASVRRASMRGCQHLGGSVLPRAMEWLRSKSFEEREAAAVCVGRLKAKSAVPVLMEVLGEGAQMAVVAALAQIGDKRATYAIARLLSEDHPASRQGERVAIIEALEALADPSTGKYLLRELSHPTWQVRLAAARALGKNRFEGASDELRVCAEDYVAEVRTTCLGGLGK